MKEYILKIINHYGVKHQLKYFQSEVFELNESILANWYDVEGVTDVGYVEHIREELADVMVMLKQFQYYYEIPDKEIEDVMKYKVQRQLERIENEEVNEDVRAMGEEKKSRR